MSTFDPIGTFDRLQTSALRFTPLGETPDALGESPLWDWREDCLWWIDGVAGSVRRRRWHDGRWAPGERFELGEHVGSIALRDGGGLVVALERDVIAWDPLTGVRQGLLAGAVGDPRVRLNDGKADRQGRFVCGGMGRGLEPLGQLLQLDPGGRVSVLAHGLKVGNGVCFSPDGRTLYYADTPARVLYACDYDPCTGMASTPRVHIDAAPYQSGIDGATVDADGRIWAALIRAARIGCFDPDGRLLGSIEAPTDLPTSLAFGGPDMSTLFVTSIRDSGSGRTVSTHPDGGMLFAIDGLDARGLAEMTFGMPAPRTEQGP